MVALAIAAGLAVALLEIGTEARADEGSARVEPAAAAAAARQAHRAEEYEMLRRLLDLVPGPAPGSSGSAQAPASGAGAGVPARGPAS